MICAINLCQGATRQKYTEVKTSFCLILNRAYVTITY